MRAGLMGDEAAAPDPVFVDETGRRRRVFTVLGVGLGVLLLAGLSLLLAGLLGASPVPLPGLPAGGQGGQHREQSVEGVGVHPTARPSGTAPATGARSGPATTGATVRDSGSGAASATAVTATPVRGNRPSTHPGKPKPSRTK